MALWGVALGDTGGASRGGFWAPGYEQRGPKVAKNVESLRNDVWMRKAATSGAVVWRCGGWHRVAPGGHLVARVKTKGPESGQERRTVAKLLMDAEGAQKWG